MSQLRDGEGYQTLIEKMAVFSLAVGNSEVAPILADIYAKYGEQLAAQGMDSS